MTGGSNARVREAEMGKCSQLGQPEAMMQSRVIFWDNLPASFGHLFLVSSLRVLLSETKVGIEEKYPAVTPGESHASFNDF